MSYSTNQIAIAAFALIILGVYLRNENKAVKSATGTKPGGGKLSNIGQKESGVIRTGIVYYEDYFGGS
jgi:hypothetical protein